MKLPVLFSFFRGRRGERGLPVGGRYLPATLLAFIARRRRSRGFYDGRTLALFRAAWQQSHSVTALLDYLLYRRDLGRPLPLRWVAPLVAGLDHLRPASRRLALVLLAESVPRTLTALPLNNLTEGARSLAPLAFYVEQRGGGAPLWLVRLHERQQLWRDDFALLLRQRVAAGICLVGNAGSLIGAGLGNKIDHHGLVVRFNRYCGPHSEEADLGRRMDLWVGAPGYSGDSPAGVDWVVSTGPDMLFRRQNWTPFETRLKHDLPVLTVPLPIWRDLVTECCAPPSAGILMLSWIRVLLGSWQGVSTVGIGLPPSGGTPYHHVVTKQLPYARHNWEMECALLSRWRSEGLRSHDFPSDRCGKE